MRGEIEFIRVIFSEWIEIDRERLREYLRRRRGGDRRRRKRGRSGGRGPCRWCL